MNNNNHSSNNTDQTIADSAWAEIVDKRGLTNLPNESNEVESTEPMGSVAPVDLTPEQLDDLELDGQLRIEGKMSSAEDSFVDAVVAKTHPESNPVQLNRPRLRVIKPSLIAGTSETITETHSATSADDLNDSPPATLSKKAPYRKSVALFASLVTTFFIGCFLGSMWWFGSDPEITVVPIPAADVAAVDAMETIPNQPKGSPLETSPEKAGIANGFTLAEGLVEQSNNEGSSVGSMAALNEETDQGDWNRILQGINDTNSNPTLVEAKQEFDSAFKSTERGLSPNGDARDQNVEISGADGPIWESKLNWNLALQFHRNGVGSAALNGEPIQAIFLHDNAAFLLRQITEQLQRRVRFMENRLGSKINGSISIEGFNFPFDDISQLDEKVKEVDRHIAKMNIRALSVEELMRVRVGYREGIVANRNKFNSINLAGKNLKFYTEDEAFTICSVLSTSEALLRNLAKKRLIWEKKEEINSIELKHKVCIAPEAFQRFAKFGFLLLPAPSMFGQSIAGIQNLGPSELSRMLQDAPSVELFRNADEFQQAKDFVYANGPPEMKLRLSIDKIDRTLTNTRLTEDREKILNAAKSGLVRDLRQVNGLARRGNFGDAQAMEPLKEVLAKRTDLQGLPLVMGNECRSDTTETSDLEQVSSSVGRTIGRFNGSLGSRDAAQNDAFRNFTIKKMVSLCLEEHVDAPSSQKLKTIDQILQIDHPRLRLEMIKSLQKSGSEAAVKLMVNKAKYDLDPEVRIAATDALAEAKPAEFRESLLEGLMYTWPVVAEHSAEALVRLNDQESIPKLIEMLDLPHPQFPFQYDGELVQRELVGINHMRNCLLCHAPSTSVKDSVRGLIPHESEPLPVHYYDPPGGDIEVPFAVRADITYLQQDFSAMQLVKDPGPWPREQRFDFVVRKKRLTPVEAEQEARRIIQTPNRNWNAIIFALRELTGEKPADNSSDSWRNIMAARQEIGK